jgi:hypothetical protein
MYTGDSVNSYKIYCVLVVFLAKNAKYRVHPFNNMLIQAR